MSSEFNKYKFIINKLPKFELSYNKILNKKVQADIYYILPIGKKSLLYFTYYNKKPSCFVLFIGKNNVIFSIKHFKCDFDKSLCYNNGTLLYGTIVNNNYFCCLDIFYFNNNQVFNLNINKKLNLFNNLFKLINTNIYLPVMCESYNECIKISKTLPYKIYGIQCNMLNKRYSLGVIKYNNNNNVLHSNHSIYAYFYISPDIREDTYNLYCKKNIFYDYALINNYKKSVYMNNLFRNIKENNNLDLLEESDSEDEFQNVNDDKYLKQNVDKILFKCELCKKFKKWIPITPEYDTNKVSSIDYVKNIV